MNILVVTPMETFATADVGVGFADGFTKLGHNTHIFRSGEQFLARRTLIDSFVKGRHMEIDLPTIELAMEGFFDMVVMNDIEMVFVIRGLIPPPIYLDKLRKLGIKTVLYNTEDPYDYSMTKDIVKNYDLVLSNDLIGPELYPNCKWVPVGVNNSIYSYNSSVIKSYDLSFIGTFFKTRVQLFEECLPLFKTLNTYFAGHWVGANDMNETDDVFGEQFGSHWDSPVREMVGNRINKTTYPESVNIILNHSKITPNPHRDKEWLGNSTYEANNFSPRVFEAAACGCFQLVSNNRRKVIRHFFEEDEIVLYDSPQNFIEQVKYFLGHPDEREKIAHKVMEKVLQEHTYVHRASQVLEFIK